ncbi:MAG: RdgB/HAM1 family non-canonical purine NTP pyrophosphatase [Myxococcales bacterium]|nr:RdgB/HAM1 family non-canonical purine NTP pyrophosphatase [Myxococcales bacterium]
MKAPRPAHRLVVATSNRGKLEELRRAFGAIEGLELISLAELPPVPEIVEDADSFQGNARKKAQALAVATGLPALADDSGLEVDALEGAPGVRSARYAGPGATDAENNARLLEALRAVPEGARSARFRCHLALADAEGRVRLEAEGRCEGRIALESRGEGGFGYDPIFLLGEGSRSMAELSPAEKGNLSHRAEASRRLAPRLEAWLASAD